MGRRKRREQQEQRIKISFEKSTLKAAIYSAKLSALDMKQSVLSDFPGSFDLLVIMYWNWLAAIINAQLKQLN